MRELSDEARRAGLRVRGLIPHGSAANRTAFSPDGEWLASTGEGGELWIRTLDDELRLADPITDSAPLVDVAWAPDGQTVAAGSADGTVYLVGVETGRVRTFSATATLNSVAWSPRGDVIAIGTNSGDVVVWNVDLHRVIDVLRGHADWVLDVAWDADGEFLCSAS